MLAQIPHVLLATQVETITGEGTNAMQLYPAVSAAGRLSIPDFASGGAERRSFRAFEGQGLGAA